MWLSNSPLTREPSTLSFKSCTVSLHQPATQRRRLALVVTAWGRKSVQQTVQATPPQKPSFLTAQRPVLLQLGAAVIAAAILVRIVKKWTSRGSLGNLESRGLIAEGEQTTKSSDPFYNRMMRNVNTVQYEELSQEQIEAARRRRMQDRKNNEKVDLSKIQLPANHPFAVSRELSEEEEQLQMARLNVRRGMPLKDINEMKGKNGTPQQPQ